MFACVLLELILLILTIYWVLDNRNSRRGGYIQEIDDNDEQTINNNNNNMQQTQMQPQIQTQGSYNDTPTADGL